MPENNWRLEPPDFSDQEKYESEGWVKIGAYDVPIKNNEIQKLCGVGTTPPLEKLGTLTVYENEDLKLKAALLDVFYQGKVYLEWIKEPKEENYPSAKALKINGKWRVKQLDESFELYLEVKEINGKKIIWKITLCFVKKINTELEIIREDLE